ncbi:MAG: hypothetical protein DDT22_00243 [candidate division WS2 bacterium]|nr:hypothetical protein [Bacillota bacterium]MBT9174583.1 hypothetical protein [Candidatus Lithacetigena glycinireducens]
MREDCNISESEVYKSIYKWYDKPCSKTKIIEIIFGHEDKNKINNAIKVFSKFNVKITDYIGETDGRKIN